MIDGEFVAMIVVGNTLLTGGTDGIAGFDIKTGGSLNWTMKLGGTAVSFAADGTRVFVGGDAQYGFNSNGRNNLASADIVTGKLDSWSPHVAPVMSVGIMAVSGDDVLIAGEFTNSPGA